MEDLTKLVGKIGESYTLKMSMVDFIPGLLMQYARGELTKSKLFTEYMRQTKDRRFYFMHMPKTEIRESQKLFSKEFVFADLLTEAIEQYSRLDDEAFNGALAKCMEDYLRALTESPEAG
jgi:hypothetical protein